MQLNISQLECICDAVRTFKRGYGIWFDSYNFIIQSKDEPTATTRLESSTAMEEVNHIANISRVYVNSEGETVIDINLND